MRWPKQMFIRRREIWQWAGLDTIWADLRFAFRQLRKSPGFALAAMLTLSLSIAATVAISGFVDSALIRPLPYPGLSRLMGVFKTTQLGSQHAGYSYPDYLDLEHTNSVFASTAAYEDTGLVLSDGRGLHIVNGIGVTPDFFRILGVRPILGSDFAPAPPSEDLQALPATVILSYSAWQNWFEGKPDVLGKTVILTTEKVPYTVIGILPRNFQFAPAGASDFWTTLRPVAGDPCQRSRGCMAMGVLARLKDGVTVQQALAAVQALAAREAKDYPDPDAKRGGNIAPLGQWILGDVQPILLSLLAGVGLLLLVAYVNVAGLLLVRSENRRREFAVRGVLGAGRRRLMQQFVTEGLVIVILSCALGLFGASFTRQLVLKLIPADTLDSMPYLRGGWNWHVIAFASALVLTALILFAVTPALRVPFADLRADLTDAGRGASGMAWRRVGAKLVILELATTMILLAGAGLLGKSLYKLLNVELGFDPSHLATLGISAPEARYSEGAQRIVLHREILNRVQNLPGVIAAGTVRDMPVTGVSSTQIGFVEWPGLGVSNEVGHQVVSPGFLSAVLKVKLLRGRFINERDNAGAPLVAIVNQTLARRYFADENPLGKQFFYHANDIKRDASQPPIQIVGVIADIKDYALDEEAMPVIYTPYDQWPAGNSIVVRTSQEPASVLPSMTAAIHEFDSEILIESESTMSQIIQSSWTAYLHRVLAWLAGGFAALALLLSAVGLYGVIAYSVSRRTREIGVRIALGATRSSVYQLILKEAGWLTLIGLVIGLSGSITAGLFLRSFLFGVRSWDVSILGGVGAVLIACASLASYMPARRAASVNPVEALRAE